MQSWKQIITLIKTTKNLNHAKPSNNWKYKTSIFYFSLFPQSSAPHVLSVAHSLCLNLIFFFKKSLFLWKRNTRQPHFPVRSQGFQTKTHLFPIKIIFLGFQALFFPCLSFYFPQQIRNRCKQLIFFYCLNNIILLAQSPSHGFLVEEIV